MDGRLTTFEAYSELKKDFELPYYDGLTEGAFKKVEITEAEAAENTYRMLEALGAPEHKWAAALEFAADGACDGYVSGTYFEQVGTYEFMEKSAPVQSGFDWSAAMIGASVGFFATIAALRSCNAKTQQEKKLAEPLL